MPRILALVLAAALALECAPAFAQAKKADVCPWCKNDPELMAAAGVVSHGPIAIGPDGSEALVHRLQGSAWTFLETTHIRWASALGEVEVELSEKERVGAELARLRKVLPGVPAKTKKLDRWLRLHLLAMRGEEFYTRFQSVLRVSDADFPESRPANGPFMGDGRYLGEKDKFEVVIHSSRASHELWTEGFCGIRIADSLRWHHAKVHKLSVSVPAEDAELRQDRYLFAHLVHNFSHLFLCAYKHFSYDPPIWLDEGLANAMEKEIEPESTTNEGEEGTKRDGKGPPDWPKEAAELVARGKAKSLAQLMHLKEFGALDQDANVTAWSMVRFLLDEHPEKFAKFLGAIKGQLDAQGFPSGDDLPDLERAQLALLWSWTPAQFDETWKAWAAVRR